MPNSPQVRSESPAAAYATKDNILAPTAAGTAAEIEVAAEARIEDVLPSPATLTAGSLPAVPTGGG